MFIIFLRSYILFYFLYIVLFHSTLSSFNHCPSWWPLSRQRVLALLTPAESVIETRRLADAAPKRPQRKSTPPPHSRAGSPPGFPAFRIVATPFGFCLCSIFARSESIIISTYQITYISKVNTTFLPSAFPIDPPSAPASRAAASRLVLAISGRTTRTGTARRAPRGGASASCLLHNSSAKPGGDLPKRRANGPWPIVARAGEPKRYGHDLVLSTSCAGAGDLSKLPVACGRAVRPRVPESAADLLVPSAPAGASLPAASCPAGFASPVS